MRIWLEDLQSCGVDLLEYGKKEKELHGHYTEVLGDCRSYSNGCTLRLVGFTYGASPEDWKVWFSEPTDEYAGDFWWLVEQPDEKPMPGMWVD